MSRPKRSIKEAAVRLDKAFGGKIIPVEPYPGSTKHWRIHCVDCGRESSRRVSELLRLGCAKCAVIKRNKARSTPHEIAVTKLQEIHHGQIIPIGKYVTRIIPWHVYCARCGKEWSPKPSSLLENRTGCPKCAGRGFNLGKPGLLYYVRVSNPFGEPVYKIGITNGTVRKRFRNDIAEITIIETWYFENGAEAFEMEQDVLNDYDADRWTGPDILESGNDELFTVDVLGLDKGAGQLELVA
jgi:predicted  nucleic acid-binding Zn-ribbon protein